MKLTVDTETGEISSDGDETPDEKALFDAIGRLISARGRLVTDPDSPVGQPTRIVPLAAWRVDAMSADASNAVIAFRFPGLGWVGATFSPEDRLQVITILKNQDDVFRALGGAGPTSASGGSLH